MKDVFTFEKHDPKEKSIYLAGPTYRVLTNDMRKLFSWRWTAQKLLEDYKFNGEVYIPEYRDNHLPIGFNLQNQVQWECETMRDATVIMFWIPRDLDTLPAFTTNIEFGEWMKSDKITIGAPDEAPKNDYIKERCRLLNIKWHNDLKELINYTMDIANFNYVDKY